MSLIDVHCHIACGRTFRVVSAINTAEDCGITTRIGHSTRSGIHFGCRTDIDGHCTHGWSVSNAVLLTTESTAKHVASSIDSQGTDGTAKDIDGCRAGTSKGTTAINVTLNSAVANGDMRSAGCIGQVATAIHIGVDGATCDFHFN